MSNGNKKMHPVVKARRFFAWTSRIALVLGGVLLIPAIFFGVGSVLRWALLLILIGLMCDSAELGHETERRALVRWGRFVRFLAPGLSLTWPLIEWVAAVIRPIDSDLRLLLPGEDEKLPSVNLVDDKALIDTCILRYKVRDDIDGMRKLLFETRLWKRWLRNKFGPVCTGFLATLMAREALDEGMARGNILDRIREASAIARRKKSALTREINNVREGLESLKEKAELEPDSAEAGQSNLYENLLEQLQTQLVRIGALPALYKRMAEDLADLIENEANMFDPDAFYISIEEVILSKEMVAARSKATIARAEAEAAFHDAVRQGILIAGPIRKVQAELHEAGQKPLEALDEAIGLEKLETIAKEGGAWAIPIADAIKEVIPALIEAWLAVKGSGS